MIMLVLLCLKPIPAELCEIKFIQHLIYLVLIDPTKAMRERERGLFSIVIGIINNNKITIIP